MTVGVISVFDWGTSLLENRWRKKNGGERMEKQPPPIRKPRYIIIATKGVSAIYGG